MHLVHCARARLHIKTGRMNFHFIHLLWIPSKDCVQTVCKKWACKSFMNSKNNTRPNEIDRLVEIEINHSRLFECQIYWRNVCAHYSWLLLFMAKSEMKKYRKRCDSILWMWKSGNHFKQPSSQMGKQYSPIDEIESRLAIKKKQPAESSVRETIS